MYKIVLLLSSIVLLTSNCNNHAKSPDVNADTSVVTGPDSTLPARSDKYVCGFTGSFAYLDNQPLAAVRSSENDSIIERRFAAIWSKVIGGRPETILIEKDGDQNNREYKYAAAKGSFDFSGNIIRHVYYKSNDLAPLINRNNGWELRAIALHEFAHHINGDPFSGASRDAAELGADDYAGMMMSRYLKTTLDTALLAFANLTEENPTNGYPNRQRRMAAVKAGWEKGQLPQYYSLVSTFVRVIGSNNTAGLNDRDFDYAEITNAVKNNALSESFTDNFADMPVSRMKIRASSSPGDFFADSSNLYFKRGDSIMIVGKIAHSNRPEYEKMVYDNFYNYMYIDKNNSLITYIINRNDPNRSKIPVVIGSLSKRNQ